MQTETDITSHRGRRGTELYYICHFVCVRLRPAEALCEGGSRKRSEWVANNKPCLIQAFSLRGEGNSATIGASKL
jgi:hypothetical protein